MIDIFEKNNFREFQNIIFQNIEEEWILNYIII